MINLSEILTKILTLEHPSFLGTVYAWIIFVLWVRCRIGLLFGFRLYNCDIDTGADSGMQFKFPAFEPGNVSQGGFSLLVSVPLSGLEVNISTMCGHSDWC